ncbi:hypothetical protein K435DRAFT_812055 [Dendrothele bispora CBS 962.96]|uniref:Uncharacterized protein n=1 Tax=Dendrothele bispora (strain CBS 962.96) TaxID=1314807 RepID=A0A4S8KRB1_DENBC|nr:hypothetical protein K435DRAFT_812055 [Dendrothele bispora CBS 962.96]
MTLEDAEYKVWNVGKNSVKGYEFKNWTTMAVAMLYVLQPTRDGVSEQLFNRLLPNRTPEWKVFKEDVLKAYDEDVEPTVRKPSKEPSDDQEVVVKNMYTDWQDAVDFYHVYKRNDPCPSNDSTLKSGESQEVSKELKCAA